MESHTRNIVGGGYKMKHKKESKKNFLFRTGKHEGKSMFRA